MAPGSGVPGPGGPGGPGSGVPGYRVDAPKRERRLALMAAVARRRGAHAARCDGVVRALDAARPATSAAADVVRRDAIWVAGLRGGRRARPRHP